MKNTILILSILTFLMLTSCKHFNDKLILKNNYVYKTEQHNTIQHGDALYYNGVYKPDGCQWATVNEQNGYVTISSINVTTLTATNTSSLIPTPAGQTNQDVKPFQMANLNTFYFAPVNNNTLTARQPSKSKFKYLEQKIMLQAISIPIKVRPALKSEALKDSFPSTTEVGVNFGLSFGWKGTYNIWNQKKNILATNSNKFSLATAILFNTSGVDLKKSNTQGYNVFDRKAVILSPGVFIGVGFNNIHVGGSVGVDYATGTNATRWIYDGKLWYGIGVSLDLLK